MSLRIFVQLDPPERLKPAGDTSIMMMEQAQARGHTIHIYTPDAMWYDAGRVKVAARPLTVQTGQTPWYTAGDIAVHDLREAADIVLMRQDPPFDMTYITAAHLLELVQPDVQVVNDPGWVRSSPEKVFALEFPDLQPPTMVGRDFNAFRAFREQHRDIVLKPLYGHGGAGVLRVKPDDGNFEAMLEIFQRLGPEPFIAQAFLPAVADGDKRILLVNGEYAGAINRRPPDGAIRSNLAAGGAAEAVEPSARDREIIARLAPELRRRGLLFVGIDLIGGHLTEINVTSPTGARAVKALSGVDAVALMWDVLESGQMAN